MVSTITRSTEGSTNNYVQGSKTNNYLNTVCYARIIIKILCIGKEPSLNISSMHNIHLYTIIIYNHNL